MNSVSQELLRTETVQNTVLSASQGREGLLIRFVGLDNMVTLYDSIVPQTGGRRFGIEKEKSYIK